MSAPRKRAGRYDRADLIFALFLTFAATFAICAGIVAG